LPDKSPLSQDYGLIPAVEAIPPSALPTFAACDSEIARADAARCCISPIGLRKGTEDNR